MAFYLKRSSERSVAVLLFVLEVAALLGEGEEVGESHSAEADVQEWVDGARLDVLRVIVVEPSLHRLLRVFDGQHRLQVSRQFPHLQALDLVVEAPPRHCREKSYWAMRDWFGDFRNIEYKTLRD